MKTWAKALVIIGVIASGTISLLFAPLISVFSVGSEVVQYDGSITQINLVTNLDSSSINIEYTNDTMADLVNITWDYTFRHSILVDPPTIVVNYHNYTIGTVLNMIMTVTFQNVLLSTPVQTATYITINPTLITNLSITTGSGSIDLNTTNLINLQFIDVNLTTSSGNCQAYFVDGCDIQGDINIQTSSGNIEISVDPNSDIDGQLTAITSSGSNEVSLGENCTILDDFLIQTSSGSCIFTLTNYSLNNNEITGIIEASSGGIRVTITQKVDPNGNLTLDMDCDSGNCRLLMDYDNNTHSSTIYPTTNSGQILTVGFSGFNSITGGYQSKNWQKSSNINATLDTDSGNVYLEGGFS